MNDYWNDPPETDELPECCSEYMTFDEETCICKCDACGETILPPKDPDPEGFLTGLPDQT